MYHGEKLNSITHLIGSVLALLGTGAMLGIAANGGPGPRLMIAVAIYGLMMVFLYVSSTLYHSLRGPAKELFHVFDHCAIYLLIAGTYTPLTLVALRGTLGWTIFAIIWALAIAGVLKDFFFRGRYRAISVLLYVLMGWLIVFAFAPLEKAVPAQGVWWLMAGGVVYTSGIVFYALSRKIRHSHGIWHMFVMGGSICHFVAVIRYIVVPAAAITV
jgi:hemolysin III